MPLVLFLLGVAGAASGLRGLQRIGDLRTADELLYLPNGRYLRIVSLGHRALMADLVYLWAIQYYSNYDRADRFRYVEHVFGNVIPELDPHYVDAYTLGALILTVEAKDVDAGLRVLDKGMRDNPDDYLLPYLAGWEAYHAGLYERSARYFAEAASKPGAPAVILRNRAGAVARAGDLREAYALWRELYLDPGSDAVTRGVAERRMRDLAVRIDLETLERAVERFRTRNGRPPRALSELVRAGEIREVPIDPDGRPYAYDPSSGKVGSTAGRILGNP